VSTFTVPGLRKALVHAKHAGQTPRQLKQRIAELDADNRTLIGDAEDSARALDAARIRGCQDSMRIAQAKAERDAAVAEVKRLQAKVTQQGAEHQRLTAANRAWEARYANEHPVHVPAPKDLRAADDRPTIPNLDVTGLRAKFRIPDGRIIHLSGAPFADPGQTTWGAAREAADTEPVPLVDLPQQREAS